jgi:hypothetical protein
MFEAALWYDREQSGLGGEFLKAVRYVFGRIEEGALQFPIVTTDIRRAMKEAFASAKPSIPRPRQALRRQMA